MSKTNKQNEWKTEAPVMKKQMKKGKKGWIVGATVFVGMLTFGGQSQVSASEWVANTPSQISQRITTGQSSITMVSGDTVYNIGEALNIKNPMDLLFDNGFKDGEQYTLQVGTVIAWDGNHVTVIQPDGTVIGDTIVKDENKIDVTKPVAKQDSDLPQVPVITDKDGNVVGTPIEKDEPTKETPKEEQKPVTPIEPSKPVTDEKPVTPLEPSTPVKPDVPLTPLEPSTPVKPLEPSKPEESNKLEELEKELAQLKLDLEVANQELSEAIQNLENAKNQSSKEEIEMEIASTEALIQLVSDNIVDKDFQIGEELGKVSDLEISIQNILDEIAVAQLDVDVAQNEFDVIYAEWKPMADSYNDTIQALQSEQNSLDLTTPEGQQRYDEISIEMTDLIQEMTNLTSRKDVAEQTLLGTKSIVDSLSNDVSVLNSELAQLNAHVSDLQNDKLSLEADLVEKQAQLVKLQEDLANAPSVDLEELERIVEEKQERVNSLTARIVQVEEEIQAIKDSFVDTTELTNLYNSAIKIDTSLYTESSVENFLNVLDETSNFLMGSDFYQEEVDTMLARLQLAIDKLVEKDNEGIEVADKTELSSKLSVAEDIKNIGYTEHSWSIFVKTLAEAQVIFNDFSATQVEVDSITQLLQSAMDGLVEAETPVEVDKSELDSVIKSTKDLVQSDYTTDSWEAFQTALNNANAVFSNDKATQSEVDTARVNLQSAIDGLVEAEKPVEVDKSELDSVIKSTKDLVQSDYTTDSWKAFQTALNNANAVLLNDKATQSEVDTARVNLQSAIDGLVKEDTEKEMSKEEYGLAVQQELFNMINQYRAENGLKAGTYDEVQQKGSDVRAKELEDNYSHDRPNGKQAKTAIEYNGSDMEEAYKYNKVLENITTSFYGSKLDQKGAKETARLALESWINSPGHNGTLLRTNNRVDYLSVGIYVAENGLVYVQMFI